MSDVYHRDCPARELLGVLAGRWTVLVLTVLLRRPHRFHQLRAAVSGISDKSLTATLRSLRHYGLVHREVGSGQPPSVTYSATEAGHSAAEALMPLLDWISANAEDLAAGAHRHG